MFTNSDIHSSIESLFSPLPEYVVAFWNGSFFAMSLAFEVYDRLLRVVQKPVLKPGLALGVNSLLESIHLPLRPRVSMRNASQRL